MDTVYQLKQKLQFITEGGVSQRYHTRPGIRPDTNAHHSHGVVMLCWLLSEGGASAALLMAAATHDLAEQVASDVSSPSKRLLGIGPLLDQLEKSQLERYDLEFTQFLGEEELRILKWADLLDGMLYACRELALGNRTMGLIYKRYRGYFQSGEVFTQLTPAALNVYNAIQLIYKEYRNEPRFDCFEGVAST